MKARKSKSRWVTLVRTMPEGTYQLELVKCGRSNCKPCKSFPSHGPYWYFYFYEPTKRGKAGRSRSRYVGKRFQRVSPSGAKKSTHKVVKAA
jgi:hypothetical protein